VKRVIAAETALDRPSPGWWCNDDHHVDLDRVV
jgi:hypothetical protein